PTIPPPPSSTPFPYTPLFRSGDPSVPGRVQEHPAEEPEHAQRAVAPGEQVDGEGRIALAGKARGHLADVLVEPEGLVDDDHARKDRKSTRLNSSHVAISYAVF